MKYESYLIRDDDGLNHTVIEITEPPFEGVKYIYGEVKPVPLPNGQLMIEFQYQILEGDKSLQNNVSFRDYIFHILQDIIDNGIEKSFMIEKSVRM